MNSSTKRVCTVTAFSLGAAAAAASQSPAFAQNALGRIESIVTCGTATACVTGNNTGSGAGVAGISAKGNGVNGLTKATSSTSAAVNGNATGGASGVLGQSNSGFGVYAKSANSTALYAVSSASSGIGSASAGNGYGAYGYSSYGVGVLGSANSGDGMEASTSSGYGLFAQSQSNDAVHAVNNSTGTAVAALATSGDALFANTGSGLGAHISTDSGNAIDASGTYIGIIGRAFAGTGGFPLVLTDRSGNTLFYVNGNGDVRYHGTIGTFLRTTRGDVRAYGTTATTPTVEDVGSSELRNGSARVKLDPAFARSVDGSSYHVFLTPDGDTRGLFVAERDNDGFVVRETQGGRGSLSFDYRIVATQSGHASDRMAFATPNAIPQAPLSKVRPGISKASRIAPPVLVKP